MDQNMQTVIHKRIERVMEALRKNNMFPVYAETKEDVPELVAGFLHEGDVVANGGSMSLRESGVMDLLRSGPYHLLDRDVPGLTGEQLGEIFRKAFSADAYLCSANAVTEDGELYNVDGNNNRVAAILYGPKSVILVVGCNKIVRNLEEAVVRVKQVSAPANCLRLGPNTYCRTEGRCMALAQGKQGITAGCAGESRMCHSYVISAKQQPKDRIKVILVGESLGY